MKNKLIKILIPTFFLTICLPIMVFAEPILQIVKNMNLSVNTPHIITFDEKIIRYKFQNEKNIKAEILSNILNTRQELLVTPLEKLANKLTIWTDSRVYNINITFEAGNPNTFAKDNCKMLDFDLDKPPEIKN